MADLITRARAQQAIASEYANANPSNELVDTAIGVATAIIESYCRRTFISTSYTERYNGTGDGVLTLDNFPVTVLARVATSRSTAVQITNTDDSTNQRAQVQVTSTGLTLTRMASGVSNSDTIAFSDYATITLLVAAVNALSGGWSATTQGDFGPWPSADLYSGQGGQYCLDTNADLLLFDNYLADVDLLDSDAGLMRGEFPYGSKNILVEYTAGYVQASLPEDLQQACARLAASLFDQMTSETGGDHGLRREKLGEYSYERFENPQSWPPGVLAWIQPYVNRRL